LAKIYGWRDGIQLFEQTELNLVFGWVRMARIGELKGKCPHYPFLHQIRGLLDSGILLRHFLDHFMRRCYRKSGELLGRGNVKTIYLLQSSDHRNDSHSNRLQKSYLNRLLRRIPGARHR